MGSALGICQFSGMECVTNEKAVSESGLSDRVPESYRPEGSR